MTVHPEGTPNPWTDGEFTLNIDVPTPHLQRTIHISRTDSITEDRGTGIAAYENLVELQIEKIGTIPNRIVMLNRAQALEVIRGLIDNLPPEEHFKREEPDS